MDNDIFIKKLIAKMYRKTSFMLNYCNAKIYYNEYANQLIKDNINNGLPCLVSRFGAVEMRCVDSYLKNKEYDENIRRSIEINAGVFPATNENLDKFCKFYLECAEKIDILSLWQVKSEKRVIKQHCKSAKFINLRGLEPYYFINPWSEALRGKKVLIIHPFKKSIITQYNKREFLFENLNVLPTFKSLEVVKAVQSNAGEKTEFSDWFKAYDFMCDEIGKKDFDVAIIGAGAYGLPLASFIKEMGKQAIHIAGATQIIFGIEGKRWDNHPIISKFYNEYWVRPNIGEKPERAKEVEGGSYW